MSLKIKQIVKRAAEWTWSVLSELVKPGTYKHISGYTQDAGTGANVVTIQSATVTMLITAYKSSEVDGQDVKYGDEKVLVRTFEMTGISDAVPGDWIESEGKRYEVKAVIRDATGQIYILQTRREILNLMGGSMTTGDWGDLSAHNSTEDWGNLTTQTSSNDWN